MNQFIDVIRFPGKPWKTGFSEAKPGYRYVKPGKPGFPDKPYFFPGFSRSRYLYICTSKYIINPSYGLSRRGATGDWTFPPEPKSEVVLASSGRTFSHPDLGHRHRPSDAAQMMEGK